MLKLVTVVTHDALTTSFLRCQIIERYYGSCMPRRQLHRLTIKRAFTVEFTFTTCKPSMHFSYQELCNHFKCC